MASDKIKVAVRVRPFNRRELEMDSQCVVHMDTQHQTILHHPNITGDKIERKPPKTFAFDHCLCSIDSNMPNYASQETVFDCLGRDILKNAFQGYNACIFAYGQTGSGKSYTMMGTQDNKGIIPRLCDALFAEIANRQSAELTCKVEVSYMEIYNEKVHDLLDPKSNKQSLKVREHNVLGPYVDGLSQLAVTSFQDIDNLMTEGNKSRTVAATNMNSESSRSHAVFSVVLTQTLIDEMAGVTGEKVSRMSLVDLAGSERAVKTGAVGERLKEGSNINKSLTTLGLVISKLADQSANTKNRDRFVPYRDSVLTWLLKDNLGGNSRTVMVATVSPSVDNYEETLSTLRYADRAKHIVNHAVVNEDPNARIIRELRQEVEALKEMLRYATGNSNGGEVHTVTVDIHQKLNESEKLYKEISQTWEEKLVKTERIQSERQQALEKMGISIQASGIKVEKHKYYLVNLNADPSLNELLVYYLKERTVVGSCTFNAHSTVEPDIQLSGLGIQAEHCIITIEDGELYLEPIAHARSFINGTQVIKRTQLRHGDRIVWGNHHFFRVNCPRTQASDPQTPAQNIDYNFARDELMLNELSNDPIQAAISRLERQHEEDKQVALEKQRLEYERQFQQLRSTMSPCTPYSPFTMESFRSSMGSKMTPCTPTTQMRVAKWAHDRNETFRRSIGQLKADILQANSLVQEANCIAECTGNPTKYSVTLQIPPANLSPNRRKGAFVSEPAILVKRGCQSQIWSMDKLENKIIDMRELYEEYQGSKDGTIADTKDCSVKEHDDLFFESQENHHLIGVANVFLEALFHNVSLDYHTPIISQQGEVAGRLQVELCRISGELPQDRICEAASDHSSEVCSQDDENELSNACCRSTSNYSGLSGGNLSETPMITCRVNIKQAYGLPISLANFVFCQYTFWNHHEPIVVPTKCLDSMPCNASSTNRASMNSSIFKFDHSMEFVLEVTEEFLEHCAEGALSIEVWGNPSVGFSKNKPGWEMEQQLATARSLVDRWLELTRKIELWVEIQELNDQGEYAAVEVAVKQDPAAGGVFQLRQGQQRRILARVKPAQNSGTLPIICQQIVKIEVGGTMSRNRLQRSLDSYQEEDLTALREKWSEALMRRREYLDQQIQNLLKKEMKTDMDLEREQSLMNQWVTLTEERNAVMVPAPGSGIPGAPAVWNPPAGMEPYIPVLFLDLNADDLSTNYAGAEFTLAGANSILPKEVGSAFYSLNILQHLEKDVCAIASWDSSIHNSSHLNKITEPHERVYMILRVTVRLSHPVPMDLVLRKRLSLNIYKRQSITDRIRRRIVRSDMTNHCGVTYEVVSNVPKASEELEDRTQLAQLAASGEDSSMCDGETYIEKYTRGVSAVESILMLDRLRQSVTVKELLQAKENPLMRKTVSVPNFSHLMKLDLSSDNLLTMSRSESVSELSSELHSTMKTNRPNRKNFKEDKINGAHNACSTISSLNTGMAPSTSTKQPFGIVFSSVSSPANSKLGLRMTTLHEEQIPIPRKHSLDLLNTDDTADEHESQSVYDVGGSTSIGATMVKSLWNTRRTLSTSRTLDSFTELPTRMYTPASAASSGYGSGAVSSTNLSSEDSMSTRSISVDDDTSEMENTKFLELIDLTDSMNYSVYSNTENSVESDDGGKQQLMESGFTTQSNHSTPHSNDATIASHLNAESQTMRRRKMLMPNGSIVPNSNKSLRSQKTCDSVDHEMTVLTVRRHQGDDHTSNNSDSSKSVDVTLPEWVMLGESVLIRPYSMSGVVAYIGDTEFASGTWIGVELDTPKGKNNGSVKGVRYFSCKPKHGMFVRADKLMLDRKGRGMRAYKAANAALNQTSSLDVSDNSTHHTTSIGSANIKCVKG